MVLSLTPAAVLALTNRGKTSSIVALDVVFTMRFLAIFGHPASFKNEQGGGCLTELFPKTEKLKIKLLSLENKEKVQNAQAFWTFGDPPEIRTPDTLLKRQVLCRLS